MNGIDKITEKILSEAREAANERIESARVRAKEIALSYSEKAKAARDKISAEAELEAQSIITRAKASVETVRRSAIISEQAAIIDEVFDEAYNSIRGLPDDKYVSFLAMLASSALAEQYESREKNLELYGPDEDESEIEKYEIILCKTDRDKYSKPLFEAIRRSVIGRVPPEIIDKLVISKGAADIDGGLILRYGDIESNCSLSLMFSHIRASLEGQVSALLFTRGE